MSRIKLNYDEKRFLLQTLARLAIEMSNDKSTPDITEKENEFFCTAMKALNCTIKPRGLFAQMLPAENIDLKKCMAECVEYGECPQEMEHPKDIMEICLEFAYVYYHERKPCERSEFFENLSNIFDLFPVKRKDYKETIERIAMKAESEGVDFLIEKYQAIIAEKEMRNGCFIIDIPQIYIPAYKVEIDISDKDTLENWEKIEKHLEALCDYIEKPKGKLSCEEISKPVDELIQKVYSQLSEAEEKYFELSEDEED